MRLALIALLLSIRGALAQQQDSAWQEGTLGQLGYGTGYSPAQGACGYGDLPAAAWPYGGLAAVDPAASPFAEGPQQGCGACLEVACADAAQCGAAQNSSLVVLITDHCAGCGAAAVYLAPSGYGQLVASGLGQVAGRARRVNCNPPGPLEVHVDQWRTSGGGWLRLALLGVAGGGDVAGVELAPSQSPNAWRPMQRAYGAAWQLSSLPATPLDLRATDGGGQQVVARRALLQAGQTGTFPTSAQFQATQNLANALGASLPPPAPPATPPPTTAAVFFGPPQPLQLLPAGATPPPPRAEPAAAVGQTIQLLGPPSPSSDSTPPPSAPAIPTTQPAGVPGGTTAAGPALALPAPRQTAPAVADTRPPRPPGVGPSVTPAPVSFSPAAGLPTLPSQPAATGPVDPGQAAAAAGLDPASCLTLGDTLARIPEAASWTQLMRSVGLDVLLRDRNARVTLLVPVASALGAAIDARPQRNESSLSQLILDAPEIANPLVGYHVLPGLWPSSTLQPGVKLNTSDTIDKVNRLQITAQGPTSLQGIGTSARILQADIVACGPSIVHIVDQVLLPFTFNQAALDAISATQVPQAAG